MSLNDLYRLIKDYKFLIFGGFLGFLVSRISNTYYITPYAPFFINLGLIYLPILFLIILIIFVDLKKRGNDIREVFVGFSLYSFFIGVSPFIGIIVYKNYDFTGFGPMYLLFRSLFIAGIFTVYERVIWFIQNKKLNANPKSSSQKNTQFQPEYIIYLALVVNAFCVCFMLLASFGV